MVIEVGLIILSKIVLLNMSAYRLDRSIFKAQTGAEAANHAAYYKKLSWQERLRIATYLINIAYNYSESTPPRIDRTIFKARARNG